MLCTKFKELNERERKIMIARIAHAIANSMVCFDSGIEIIALADQLDLYKGVQLLPEAIDEQPILPTPGG